MLVLSGGSLVIGIGRLEPGAACRKVQMERIGRGRIEIDPVKKTFAVAPVVKRSEFRRIEKTARIRQVCGQEISPPLPPHAHGEIQPGCSEGAVLRRKAASRLELSQPGTGFGIDNQACL